MNLEELQNGRAFLVDKPLDWTSFQVVNKLKYAILNTHNIKKIKIGHAGTLDPKATGLLIICCGKFTKKISEFQAQEKTYTGTIKLGATTPSFDVESKETQHMNTDDITHENIRKTAISFIGKTMQKPPMFSALKKNGVRLYELARKGEEVDIPEREINISKFEITDIKMPFVKFEIQCSKGTYIRSIANDFGQKLNNLGYLTSLRRIAIGNHEISKEFDENNLIELIKSIKN